MTSIRNLPLAARLGGAFGVLCLALAIVAFAGMHRDDRPARRRRQPRRAPTRRRRAARRHAGARQGQRGPDRASICTSTTATWPPRTSIAKEIEGNWAKNKQPTAPSSSSSSRARPSRTSSPPRPRTRAEMRRSCRSRRSRPRATRPSRTPRSAPVRARSTSASCSPLDERAGSRRRRSSPPPRPPPATPPSRRPHATHSQRHALDPHRRVVAILLAIALAVWVTRSVVRPVKALERPHDQPRRELPDRPRRSPGQDRRRAT